MNRLLVFWFATMFLIGGCTLAVACWWGGVEMNHPKHYLGIAIWSLLFMGEKWYVWEWVTQQSGVWGRVGPLFQTPGTARRYGVLAAVLDWALTVAAAFAAWAVVGNDPLLLVAALIGFFAATWISCIITGHIAERRLSS